MDQFTIQDDLDREVAITARPERVAILTGSFADVWCLAGGLQGGQEGHRRLGLGAGDYQIGLHGKQDFQVRLLNGPQALHRVGQAGEPETVLYVRATGSTCKVKNSQGTVLGEMLADLGTVNIASYSSP